MNFGERSGNDGGDAASLVVELAARLARSRGNPTPNRALAMSTTQGVAANIGARAIVNQPETPVWLVVENVMGSLGRW